MLLSTLAAWFTGLLLAVTGISHLAQPRLWADLFKDLLAKPYAGLVIGVFTVQTGLLVLLAHWSWALRPSLAVTILGACWTFKGTLYMVHPAIVQRVARRHLDHPGRFRIAGVVALAIAGFISTDLPSLSF